MYKLGTYLFNSLFKLIVPSKDRKKHRIRNYLGSVFYNLKYACETKLEKKGNYLALSKEENKPKQILQLTKDEINCLKTAKKITKDFTRPFIIKGYFNDTKPIQDWDFKYLSNNHGDFKVSCLKLDLDIDNPRPKGLHIPVKEFISRILNKEKLYLTVDLDLVEELDLKQLKFKERVGNLFKFSGYNNLFLGGGNSYTPLHSELPASCAVQVVGSKKWYIIEPKYSHSLHSVVGSNGFYYAPPYCFAESKNDAKIWKIPRYEVTCEPGDFFYCPSWYWHETKNIGKENLMICSRPLFNTVHIKNNPIFAASCPLASLVFTKTVLPRIKTYIDKSENVVQSLKKMENRVPLKYIKLKLESINRDRLKRTS
ncbi:MAG: hypothetical protein GY830_06265 [Bacteroidetes bacterium]|nr:hypothetical protein [Bacteroidota bacterium]